MGNIIHRNNCPYYSKQCTTFCARCDKEVCCPRCHNMETNDDEHFQTSDRTYFKCSVCSTKVLLQKDMQLHCPICAHAWGDYFCPICGIICYEDGKRYWHCSECGCCQKGDKSKEFVHCKDCNMCVEKNKPHACYNSECPICLQHFSKSYGQIVYPSCNHLIHQQCLHPSLKECPLCRMAYPRVSEQELVRRKNESLFDHQASAFAYL